MQTREDGIQEIYQRIVAVKDTLGLHSYKRRPTQPATERDIPCVFLIEGPDRIIQSASRSGLGYPAKRSFEIFIELISRDQGYDLQQNFAVLRSAIFTDSSTGKITPIVAEDTFINENRIEGPQAYGLPGILVVSLVLEMFYKDIGIN